MTAKPIPHFKSEAEERAFWESHDSADYLDWSKGETVEMPNLRRRTVSPDLIGAEQTLKHAAQRARQIALQTNTPCIVRKDGARVDITKQSVSDTPPAVNPARFPI